MRHLAPLLLALVVASPALAQEEAPPSPEAAAQAEVARGPQPFGANLFSGNYAAERENGLNPDYRILPGDRVMVNAWGAVTINDVFAVDTQGNIFLPGIGPIQLEGVASDQLTPSRLAMPLIRMVARPRRTSSCGKEAIDRTGDFSENSSGL